MNMFVSDQVAKFHHLNSTASQFIYLANFQSINFQPVSLTLSYSNLKEKIDIKRFTALSKFEFIVGQSLSQLYELLTLSFYTNILLQHY